MNTLTETTETRYHKKFTVYKNDTVIGRSLKLYGEYGQIEIDFLLSIIGNITNQPVVVYDVGANIGAYTVAFASAGAEVHCFEPNPLNFDLLQHNTGGLDNVHCRNVAATNVAGDIMIQTFDPAESGNYGKLLINNVAGVAARAVRLDDLDIPAPNLIKIDAEGSELGVIQGAVNKIRENLPLVCYDAQLSPHLDKIYTILTDLGYHLYWAAAGNYNTDNFKNNPDNVWDTTAVFSVIAVPPGWDPVQHLDPVTGPDDTWLKFLAQ